MMKLIEYLLKNKVKSKETAEHLIKNGLVLVNGCAITLKDIPVDDTDDIKLLDKNLDVPGSFWKLKEIQDKARIIQKGDFVLDIGSEDGGFPIFAKELKSEVSVLSLNELNFLEEKEIEFKKCNVMMIDPNEIFKTKFDLIINELKLDLIKSFQILEKFLDLLGTRGKLLIFLSSKGRDDDNLQDMAEKILNKHDFDVLDFFEVKKGFYVYAKKAYPQIRSIN